MSSTRKCAVGGCEAPVLARGYCNAHYKKLWRYGSPTGSPTRPTPRERFESKIHKTADCWEWGGTILNNGYGRFMVKKKTVLVHRYSYELYVGEVPEGLVIDHLCRNRRCVNPDHLEPVTNEENLFRGLGYRIMNGMDDSCIRGHKYTEENTYWPPNGGAMRCRMCARQHDRNRNRKRASK